MLCGRMPQGLPYTEPAGGEASLWELSQAEVEVLVALAKALAKAKSSSAIVSPSENRNSGNGGATLSGALATSVAQGPPTDLARPFRRKSVVAMTASEGRSV